MKLEGEMASVQQLKAALEKDVSGGKCIFATYGDFSDKHKFGFARTWANKNTLDAVAAALKQDPNVKFDLTLLLYNSKTRYPSVIDDLPSKPPSPAQKARARVVAQQIINRYAPGTKNPY